MFCAQVQTGKYISENVEDQTEHVHEDFSKLDTILLAMKAADLIADLWSHIRWWDARAHKAGAAKWNAPFHLERGDVSRT